MRHGKTGTGSRNCGSQEDTVLWVGVKEEKISQRKWIDSISGCGSVGGKIIKARAPKAWQRESPGQEGACSHDHEFLPKGLLQRE